MQATCLSPMKLKRTVPRLCRVETDGIRRLVMLSGDDKDVAAHVAGELAS